MILFVVGLFFWLFVAGCPNLSQMSTFSHFLLLATFFDFDLFTWVLKKLTPVGCDKRKNDQK